MVDRSGCRIKRSQQSQTSLVQSSVFTHYLFPPFFPWCVPLLTGSHHSPSVSIISLLPPKSHAPIHELILLMSGQCTNPGPSYPCPVCLRPFRKSQYSFKCSSCLSWVHQKCSGLASYELHHERWHCPKCQTPSPSPSKEKPPSPLFPSPTSIPPLFPPQSPPLFSPPPLMGRPLLQQLPNTPQPPLIGRLTPLISIRTSPTSLSPFFSSHTNTLLQYILSFLVLQFFLFRCIFFCLRHSFLSVPPYENSQPILSASFPNPSYPTQPTQSRCHFTVQL